MMKDEAKWAYWGQHIKAWRVSGLSRHAYCEREGLKATTFDYWRPLIVTDHADVETVKQAVSGNDITLVPVAVDRPRTEVPSETIKLKSPSGWEVNLPMSIKPDWLITVLRQLP
jgi:hypothetical protein